MTDNLNLAELIARVRKLEAENEHLKDMLRRTVDSGLLCDPGCCGECVCDQLREAAK
jgi:hypothetical protein